MKSNYPVSYMDENQTKRYRKKYKFLIRQIKALILENAALCDEVARNQESISIVKDERKFLLHKLLEYENDMDSAYSSYRSKKSNTKMTPISS